MRSLIRHEQIRFTCTWCQTNELGSSSAMMQSVHACSICREIIYYAQPCSSTAMQRLLRNLERARSFLKTDGVDLALVSSPGNACHFSQVKSGIQSIVGWWNAPMIVLLPVSSDVKPALVANVVDSPAAQEQKNPREPRFHGRFVLCFGERPNKEEARIRQIHTQCTAGPRDTFQIVSDFIRSLSADPSFPKLGLEGHHLPALAGEMLTRIFLASL